MSDNVETKGAEKPRTSVAAVLAMLTVILTSCTAVLSSRGAPMPLIMSMAILGCLLTFGTGIALGIEMKQRRKEGLST